MGGRCFEILGRVPKAELRGCSDTFTARTCACEPPTTAEGSAPWHAVADRVRVLAPAGSDAAEPRGDSSTPQREARGEPFAAARSRPLAAAVGRACSPTPSCAGIRPAYRWRTGCGARSWPVWPRSRPGGRDRARRAAGAGRARAPPGAVQRRHAVHLFVGARRTCAATPASSGCPRTRASWSRRCSASSVRSRRRTRSCARSNRFVTYGHDDEITAALSAWCAHRVIWGGDEAVAAIRPLPLPPARERARLRQQVLVRRDRCRPLSPPRRRRSGPGSRPDSSTICSGSTRWRARRRTSCSGSGVRTRPSPRPASSRTRSRPRSAGGGSSRPYPARCTGATYAFGLAASADVRVVLEHPGFVGVHVRDRAALDKDVCGGGLVRHVPVAGLAEVLRRSSTRATRRSPIGVSMDATLRELAARCRCPGARSGGADRRGAGVRCRMGRVPSGRRRAAAGAGAGRVSLRLLSWLRLATAEALPEIGALLERVFPRERPWAPDLEWQYLRNPAGPARYVNAYAESGALIAHYACCPRHRWPTRRPRSSGPTFPSTRRWTRRRRYRVSWWRRPRLFRQLQPRGRPSSWAWRTKSRSRASSGC